MTNRQLLNQCYRIIVSPKYHKARLLNYIGKSALSLNLMKNDLLNVYLKQIIYQSHKNVICIKLISLTDKTVFAGKNIIFTDKTEVLLI